tara:strand:+ start:897 stop:1196 length:300 start_codon:yes stop_codon:yes gene_type:complete
MAAFNDRKNIFPGVVRSHRGKTITDIGGSPAYLNFIEQVNNATNNKIAVIPNTMEGRPDLIAYAAYGNELLWWLIVEANNAYDYEVDLGAGKTIIIPNI